MKGIVALALMVLVVFTTNSDGRKLDSFKKIKDALDETSEILKELKREVIDKKQQQDECEDEAHWCSNAKSKEGDKWNTKCQSKKLLQEKCKKTCGLCGDATDAPGTKAPGTKVPATDASTENPGACEDEASWCSKDKEHFGDKWETICERFLHKKCKKTCGMCDGSTDAPPPGSSKAPSTDAPLPGSSEVPSTDSPTGTDGGMAVVSGLEKCSDSNKGHCECADVSEGFQTYVFQIDGVTRCFTVYHPLSRSTEKLPVVISSQCYGKDRLSGIHMISASKGSNAAADRYGFARVGLSTPDGHWTFGNDGVVNDQKPMPCSESDSKDITYLKKVFEFLENNPEKFDTSRVYTEGFSQNSMFSAYIGFCFSDKVVGIWQGGSGLAYTGEGPNLPGCQAQCKASVFASSSSCNQCIMTTSCTECQYWPIYPCFQSKRPVIDCLADYKNDYIASDREDPEKYSTAKNMYETLVNEGHDARLLRFDKSSDDSIPGGHQNPKNTIYWQIGCLGITSPCSLQCEASFKQCMGSSFSDASARASKFESCMEDEYAGLAGCTPDCAPTFEMLKESETPVESQFSRNLFGANTEDTNQKPGTSKCSA